MLWDVDYTLVSADGLGTRLYEVVFREMFGRELPAVAPKAGRTDRAIILDTLAMAGLDSPRDRVDDFLATLARQVAVADGIMDVRVRALPGASAAIAAIAAIDADTATSDDAASGGVGGGGGRNGSQGGIRQSVLTGNIRPLAALKLRRAGLSDHLDLDIGAYGDVHEVRAELVPVARLAARQAYGADFGGWSTVLVGDTPLDVEAALAAGARVVGVATGSYSQEELAAAGAHAVLPDLTDTARVRAVVMGALLTGLRDQFEVNVFERRPGHGQAGNLAVELPAQLRHELSRGRGLHRAAVRSRIPADPGSRGSPASQRPGLARGHDAARGDHRDPVGQRLRFVQVVGGQHDRDPVPGAGP